jgi:hypothetical protein
MIYIFDEKAAPEPGSEKQQLAPEPTAHGNDSEENVSSYKSNLLSNDGRI